MGTEAQERAALVAHRAAQRRRYDAVRRGIIEWWARYTDTRLAVAMTGRQRSLLAATMFKATR
jgi:hypothetical protein